MAKTIDLSQYKKKILGDRQLYLDENNVVIAEKYLNLYWLFYPASTNIKVVEDGDTIRIIVDDNVVQV